MSKWKRFLLGFGKRGAEMSILWNIVSCGFGTGAGNWIQQMGSCIWSESFWPEKGKYHASDKEDLFSFLPSYLALIALIFFFFQYCISQEWWSKWYDSVMVMTSQCVLPRSRWLPPITVSWLARRRLPASISHSGGVCSSPTQFAIKTKFRPLKPEGRWVSSKHVA